MSKNHVMSAWNGTSLLATLLIGLLLQGSAIGADWPHWRGPTGDAHAPDKGINKEWNKRPPKELWHTPMDDVNHSGACVAAGSVFTIDHAGDQDIVRALDVKTGKEIWQFKYTNTSNNGHSGWSNSTPAYDSGRLYVLSAAGELRCLDVEKRKEIWMRNIQKEFNGKCYFDYNASTLIEVCVLPGSTLAGDWPHFGGPNSDCSSPEKGINKDWKAKPPKELWRVALTDSVPGSSPGAFAGFCIVGGKLFISDHDHKAEMEIVRAIDVKTGKDIWQYKYPTTFKSWQWGFSTSVPASDSNSIYVLDRVANLTCIDAEKGDMIWNLDISAEFCGRKDAGETYVSPVIAGSNVLVVVNSGDAPTAVDIVAVNKKTGAVAWKLVAVEVAPYNCSTPTIGMLKGKLRCLLSDKSGLVCIDPEDGKVVWKLQLKGINPVRIVSPIIVGDNVLLSDSAAGGSYMVSAEGALLWRSDEKLPGGGSLCAMNSPVCVDGYIYGNGHCYRGGGVSWEMPCLEAKTGKVMWKHKMFEGGGTVAVDGVIIALHGDTAELIMIKADPTEYKELGRLPTPFKSHSVPSTFQCWTQPAVADGRLFVRNENELVCFDLK